MFLAANLDEWERLAVADALEDAEFMAKQEIIRQGDEGNDFYIIVEVYQIKLVESRN